MVVWGGTNPGLTQVYLGWKSGPVSPGKGIEKRNDAIASDLIARFM